MKRYQKVGVSQALHRAPSKEADGSSQKSEPVMARIEYGQKGRTENSRHPLLASKDPDSNPPSNNVDIVQRESKYKKGLREREASCFS